MTLENKELLIQDLCARLPYGVKMNHIADNEHSPKTLIGIAKDMITLKGLDGYEFVDVEHYKPYLFPLSNINKEKREEIEVFVFNDWYEPNSCKVDPEGYIEILGNYDISGIYPEFCKDFVNYLLLNHFDINRLIPMGLAKDATGLNIY